jgi:electron transfer flavoprotein alpha subunit
MKSEIFVMAEHREGEIEESSLAMLSQAKRLNEQLDNSCRLSAIVIGHGLKGLDEKIGQYGADQVYFFENEQLERYWPEIYTDLITQLVEEQTPDLFLLAETALGSDLAPRIAARLRVGLVTRCVDLRFAENGQLEVVRPVSSQYLYQRVAFRNQGLKMVTLSPAAMTKEDPDNANRAKVIRIVPVVDPQNLRTRYIEFIKADPKELDLAEADVIVCGGRGIGKDAFEIIHEFADALSASVGGTRPIVDWGLLPYERQIGQTGAYVSPTVLVACGLSGANEFTAGAEGAKRIIAINIDRTARIFKFADLGLIGDVHKIVPLLIEKVRRLKQNPTGGGPPP